MRATQKDGFGQLKHLATTTDLQLNVSRSVSEAAPRIVQRDQVSLVQRVVMLVLGDIVGTAAIGVLVFSLYASPLNYDASQLWVGLGTFLIGWITTSWALNLYCRGSLLSGASAQSLSAIVACALTFGIVLLLGFALKFIGGVSRVWLLTWAVGCFAWLVALRTVWAYFLRRSLHRGKCLDRALVLAGSDQQARRLSDVIERESRGHIAVVSTMAIPGTADGVSIDWVDDAVRGGVIDRVLIFKSEGLVEQLRPLLARLIQLSVDVTWVPDLAGLQMPVRKVDRIGMLPAIDLASRPLTPLQVTLKRAEDVFLSCLILLATAPVFALIALAIKLDSRGPVLFGQLREGYHNSVFKVWKFRTMYDAARDEGALKQTSRHDTRVTRVGRILRCLSLDELPQFINVIRGDMSVVGPRPHALGMTSVGLPMAQVLEQYASRHRLKPGITGWAQINGCRGEIDSHEKLRRRVSLDCYYIDNWSLALDFWIILRTFALLLFDPDAY